MPVEIDLREVRRYLGMQKAGADEVIDDEIRRAVSDLQDWIRPASVYSIFPLSWKNGMPVIAGNVLESRDLARNLKGCVKAALLAATIGMETDRQIRRAQLRSMKDAALLQAASAAMIEQYTDIVNEEIIREGRDMGLFPRPRYSPGYGDLSLETQKIVFSLLNPEKHAGILLTDSLLMVPSKSITAVIGLSETESSCIRYDCEECTMQDTCAFRSGENNHENIT